MPLGIEIPIAIPSLLAKKDSNMPALVDKENLVLLQHDQGFASWRKTIAEEHQRRKAGAPLFQLLRFNNNSTTLSEISLSTLTSRSWGNSPKIANRLERRRSSSEPMSRDRDAQNIKSLA